MNVKMQWGNCSAKALSCILAAAMLMSVNAVSAAAAVSGWRAEASGWKYYEQGSERRGWIKLGQDWYFLDEASALMRTGWYQDAQGRWFFFNTVSDGSKGKMLCGWQWIDGKCYYFDEDALSANFGQMFAGRRAPDGSLLDADGHWVNASGNVVFVAGKGLPGVEAKQAAKTAAHSASRRGGGGGGGGSSSGGSSENSGKEQREPEAKPDKPQDKPENQEEKGKASSSDAEKDKPQEKATGSNAELEDHKEIENDVRRVVDYVRKGKKSFIFEAEKKEQDYKEQLPSSVRFILNSGEQLVLRVLSWRFEEVPAEGMTITARAEIEVPAAYSELEASIKELKVGMEVEFRKAEAPDDPTPPGQGETPEEAAEIIGYVEIEEKETPYIDRYASSYLDQLPKTITYKLSKEVKGKKMLELPVSEIGGWTAEGRIEPGTVSFKAVTELPLEYGYMTESFERVEVIARLKLTAPLKELTLSWDDGKEGDEHSYKLEQNPVITLNNFEGSAEDIKEFYAYPDGAQKLSEGAGYHYDPEKKTITLDTAYILSGGYKSSVRISFQLGSKSFWGLSINYSSDRQLHFEGEGYSNRAEYTDVSRKTALKKRVTVEKISDEELQKGKFYASPAKDAEALTDVSLTREGEVWSLILPYETAKKYMSHNSWSGDTVTLYYRVAGVEMKTLRIVYRGLPKAERDKSASKRYFAAEKPLLRLRNFEEGYEAQLQLCWYEGDKAEGEAHAMQANVDYHFDAAKHQLTLESEKLLGRTALDADRDITVRVSAGEDFADVTIGYKKNLMLTAVQRGNAVIHGKAEIQISGYEAGLETKLLTLTHQEKSIACIYSAVYAPNNGSFSIFVPYSALKDMLQENQLTLRLGMSGANSQEVTVRFMMPDVSGDTIGLKVMEETGGWGNEKLPQQDGFPIYSSKGSINLEIEKNYTATDERLQNLGVTLRKEGTEEEDGIELSVRGISERTIDWKTGEKQRWLALTALYTYAEQIGTVEQTDGKWPVYTLTLYMEGHVKKELKLVLKDPLAD